MPSPYNRVLLKLSGEVFGGGRIGLDPDVVRGSPRSRRPSRRRPDLVVVGGGNFFRGAELQKKGLDRDRADYMGMLGIVMNCLALQDFLEKAGRPPGCRPRSRWARSPSPTCRCAPIRHLEKGRVVIFGAGFGVPFFSTDTVAAQRALETHSDVVLISKNGVDGVYTADPRKDPTAERLEHLTYAEALRQRLKVVDAAAFALAQENKLPMVVFGMEGEGNIVRAVAVRRSARWSTPD